LLRLSIIVFIHEYGHYIVGKWCGIKAEIFSIGFGPVIFSRIDRFGTKWQIAALPLGGFVKFIRDDESLNFDKENREDVFVQTRSFDTAPLMARALTVVAGPIANFILSFLILISFLLINGMPSNKVILSNVKDHPVVLNPLLPNDEIISINGYETPTLNSFYALVKNEYLKETVKYTIKRNGLVKEMSGPNPFPALIDNVTLRSSAFNAGLKSGDVIQEINSFKIYKFTQLQDLVTSIENYPINLKVWRGGEILDFLVTPKLVDYPKQGGGFDKRKLIGITAGSLFEFERTRINFFEATWLSIQQIYGIITGSLDGIKILLLVPSQLATYKGLLALHLQQEMQHNRVLELF
jgi:regulator of sigma E protease